MGDKCADKLIRTPKEAEKIEERVKDNLNLVHACAGKFAGRGAEYEDIFQAGCLGLTKAAERFDESLGYKFSTYAVPLILGEIRGLFRYGGAVKISRDIKSLACKAHREAENFEKKEGRAPHIDELSAILGKSREEVIEALAALLPTETLEGEEVNGAIEDSAEVKLTERLTLLDILEKLKEEERKLITLRYFSGKSQSETAKYFGVSQMQISRREKKILLYIRGVFGE